MVITGGVPQENSLLKGTMKWDIAELMIVNKKGGITSTNSPYRSILGFRDNKKSRGNPK